MTLPGAAANGPFVVGGTKGALDFELTVIGKAGTTLLLFGPVGGALAAGLTSFAEGCARAGAGAGAGTGAAATGARASETDGFESIGGVGPGAGDTVERGVTLLAIVDSCALSFTGSSFGG